MTRCVATVLMTFALACHGEPSGADDAGDDAQVDAADTGTSADTAPSGEDGAVVPDAQPTGDAALEDAAVPDAGDPGECPLFGPAERLGFNTDPRWVEASGIAAGRRNPGLLWSHGDGSRNTLVALSPEPTIRGFYRLDVSARDWEDIALGPGPTPDQSYIYVGDIGDNSRSRSEVRVFVVLEPLVGETAPWVPETLPVEMRIRLQYPTGSENAEALMVDPRTNDIYIVTKVTTGLPIVYAARAPHVHDALVMLEEVTVLNLGSGLVGEPKVSGGDIRPSGGELAIRTGDEAFVWQWPESLSLREALAVEPCPVTLVPDAHEEAIGYASDGMGFFTKAEAQIRPLYFYPRLGSP